DFARVMRSPGSTLKPFIFALALERGVIRPTDVLADLPEGASGIGNADGQYLGPLLPRQALANSRNVPAANLLRRTGLETNFRFLRDL
ncbi:glycosyl transferase, partial [Citrobacter sp. AAK_AS5]